MITDLSVVDDVQLARMENDIKQREIEIKTDVGKRKYQRWLVKMLAYFVESGYRLPDADVEHMAVVRMDQLSDAIVLYGESALEQVARQWVMDDTRAYKQFPTSGDILAKAKEMLGNPIAEVARRNHEAYVQRMVEQERKELLGSYTKEQLIELERKYKK